MNEQRENISALMDDFQATEDDYKALNDLLADVNQRRIVQRYQLIGDTLRNELPAAIKPDFAAGVMAQIDQEPLLSTSAIKQAKSMDSSSRLWSWLFKPVAGLAVATAVAVVTISTFQKSVDNTAPDQVAAIESSQARVELLAETSLVANNARKVSTAEPELKVSNGMNWKVKRNESTMQNKLNIYLINHNEYSNSMSGIIPQARVVGFDDQK